jgi:hypothetical protein
MVAFRRIAANTYPDRVRYFSESGATGGDGCVGHSSSRLSRMTQFE